MAQNISSLLGLEWNPGLGPGKKPSEVTWGKDQEWISLREGAKEAGYSYGTFIAIVAKEGWERKVEARKGSRGKAPIFVRRWKAKELRVKGTGKQR